jgi:hypothetical protein
MPPNISEEQSPRYVIHGIQLMLGWQIKIFIFQGTASAHPKGIRRWSKTTVFQSAKSKEFKTIN